MAMEDSRAVSAWMGSQEILMGRIQDIDEVVAEVNAVTEEDVLRVAMDLLETRFLNAALVGPFRGQARLRRMLKM